MLPVVISLLVGEFLPTITKQWLQAYRWSGWATASVHTGMMTTSAPHSAMWSWLVPVDFNETPWKAVTLVNYRAVYHTYILPTG